MLYIDHLRYAVRPILSIRIEQHFAYITINQWFYLHNHNKYPQTYVCKNRGRYVKNRLWYIIAHMFQKIHFNDTIRFTFYRREIYI